MEVLSEALKPAGTSQAFPLYTLHAASVFPESSIQLSIIQDVFSYPVAG